MSQTTYTLPTNHLGRPCRFTEAKNYFDIALEQAQEKDLRDIKQDVGRILLEMQDRVLHSSLVANRMCSMAAESSDELLAFMEVLAAYDKRTCDIFTEFAGLVLAGFDKAQGGAA